MKCMKRYARKMNGYNKSLFDTEQGKCFYCNRYGDTARHEMFYGIANRQKAKTLGYWVNLCVSCHMSAHAHPNSGVDRYLKQTGQKKYEKNHTRQEFINEWGRSYL